jgi:hypothetical protein
MVKAILWAFTIRKGDLWSLTIVEGSDILYLGAVGKHLIILNSVEAANELCGDRSATYSSRPHLTMITELYIFFPLTGR